jgi:hypothetical protein
MKFKPHKGSEEHMFLASEFGHYMELYHSFVEKHAFVN